MVLAWRRQSRVKTLEEEGKLSRVLFRRSFCVGLEPSESTVVDRRDGKTRLDEDEEVKW